MKTAAFRPAGAQTSRSATIAEAFRRIQPRVMKDGGTLALAFRIEPVLRVLALRNLRCGMASSVSAGVVLTARGTRQRRMKFLSATVEEPLMISKAFAGVALVLISAFTGSVAVAMGPAGIAGGHMGGAAIAAPRMQRVMIRPRQVSDNRGGLVSGAGIALPSVPFPTNDPDHYHQVKIIGRLAKDVSGLTIDQQTVWMRLDGQTIPMAINGDTLSNSLQLDQGDELGQTLYRLILSRELKVVGDQRLRAQIFQAAAANPANARDIEVDGFVYDRTTPYLVLVSVGDAP
jgi:hypothetical protein